MQSTRASSGRDEYLHFRMRAVERELVRSVLLSSRRRRGRL